jgi:hypothetical protein
MPANEALERTGRSQSHSRHATERPRQVSAVREPRMMGRARDAGGFHQVTGRALEPEPENVGSQWIHARPRFFLPIPVAGAGLSGQTSSWRSACTRALKHATNSSQPVMCSSRDAAFGVTNSFRRSCPLMPVL